MAGLGPRVLQVLEFAHARAPELQALHELSQHEETTNSTDTKLETQKNQRRRRANAFKAHKMPQRLRFTPQSRIQGSARCRKHKRRPHKLLQERAPIEGAEKARARWLPSHMWHAKRMVMKERFGYVLAARRSDKSVSAALQALRSKATLHDASYYGVIELYGLPQVILEALQLVSDPNGSDFHGLRFLAGDEEGLSILYHEGQFPQGAIAPVTFMWRPLGREYDDGFKLHEDWQSTKRQLWIWVHPSAYMEAATAIAAASQEVVAEDEEGIEMHDRRGQLCRLKLRGRLADELITGLASDAGDEMGWKDVEEEEASDHEDGFDEKQTMASCRADNRRNLLRTLRTTGKKTETGGQKDAIYCVDVKDIRLARWKEGKLCHRSVRPEAGFSLLNEPPARAIPEAGTCAIESPLSGLSLSSLGKDAEEPESKMILKEMQALLAWTTGDSSETSSEDLGHASYPSAIAGGELSAEEDDSSTEVESSPCSLLWSLSKRRKIEKNFVKDHELNEAVYRQRKGDLFVNASDGTRVKSQPFSIMAIKKREPFPRTSGWDVICSPSSVPGLLKAFVFGGALVVGLEEDAALCTVLHQASFPCDFPDTQAGQTYWEDQAQGLKSEQSKKPKSKRFNYEKHGVKSPFQPRWESLFDSQNAEAGADEEMAVQLPCVLRGEKYMEPFSFYPSRSSVNEAMSSSAPDAESIVPVPMPTLVRVVIAFPRRGNVAVNAMIFAPSTEDCERFRSDESWQGYNVDLSKRNKAATDERSLVGYVTSAVYDRPKGAFRATGFVACEPLQQLFLASQGRGYSKKGHYALAMLRSPQGRMMRPVLIHAEV